MSSHGFSLYSKTLATSFLAETLPNHPFFCRCENEKEKKDRVALALPLNFVLFLVRVFIPLMYQSSTRLE